MAFCLSVSSGLPPDWELGTHPIVTNFNGEKGYTKAGPKKAKTSERKLQRMYKISNARRGSATGGVAEIERR
tara:strand:+ start:469 stop:684 length:216 start_codon:yes stop_codon:yes gene_type:complete